MPRNDKSFKQKPCSLLRRLLAMLYDAVIVLGLLMLASAVALPFGEMNKIAFRDFWFTLWLVTVCAAYFTASWHNGMTVGMRAWKLQLMTQEGKKVSWPRCLLRFLVALISISCLGLGVFWALVDKQKRGWHDLAAGTLLVHLVDDGP